LGYPTRPYLSDPGAFAMVEIHEGMYLPGIYDLKSSIQRVNLEADSPIWHLADSKFRHMVTWMVSEPNGQPIELSRNDQSWRKFALAMDFSRPDEELQEDFKRFLNEARKNYSLPASKKSERLTRGRPLWLTTRFCQDALNALGAHRLVAAAQNDINDAFSFAKQRLAVLNAEGHADYHWSLDYSTKKELSRAAKKYPAAAARLFGSL